MSKSDDSLFSGGRPNPAMAGIPLRFCSSGSEPDPERIASAAAALRRPVRYVDEDGYEHEVIAATNVKRSGELAYVACSSKQLEGLVAVSFEFRVRDAQSNEVATEVESYNPYFGCDVQFLEWFDDVAVLIYREKHDTYLATATTREPAHYRVLPDFWVIRDDVLAHWGWRETRIQRLRLPHLEELESISEAEAQGLGVCPPKHW